jgi:hypothetical protein
MLDIPVAPLILPHITGKSGYKISRYEISHRKLFFNISQNFAEISQPYFAKFRTNGKFNYIFSPI